MSLRISLLILITMSASSSPFSLKAMGPNGGVAHSPGVFRHARSVLPSASVFEEADTRSASLFPDVSKMRNLVQNACAMFFS